jgi:hypothetical protein
VEVRRCANGRLRNSYPVAARDLEVQVLNPEFCGPLSEVLVTVVRAARAVDPHCRKIVYAVDRGRERREAAAMVSAAEAAGFRYVVDVDITGAELSLLVSEPDWVTRVDMDRDRVPGS